MLSASRLVLWGSPSSSGRRPRSSQWPSSGGRRTAGAARLLLASGGAFGTGIAGLAGTDGYVVLLAVLATLYAASGLYDVGINAAAVELEQGTGRRYMPILHATFSGGGAVGALSAGGLLSADLDYRYVYLLVLVPLAAVILTVATVRLPPPTEETEEGTKAGRFGLYRSLPLILVAAIAALGLLSEGEVEHWSGIYLRQSLALPSLLGASGVAVFHASMTVDSWGPPGW